MPGGRVRLFLLGWVACAGVEPGRRPGGGPGSGRDSAAGPAETFVRVFVTLDGVPVGGASVAQGGRAGRWQTGPDGSAFVEMERFEDAANVVIAAHPEARMVGVPVPRSATQVTVALTRFAADDPTYLFADPGAPGAAERTDQCLHCHGTLGEHWYPSRHRASARNPLLQHLYRGTVEAVDSAACAARGGAWTPDAGPEGSPACRVGAALPDLLGQNGACADCHAPALDGVLGGRDLREVSGRAYHEGIHCDLCHKVEAVDLSLPAGVAGRLRIHRPSEPDLPSGRQPLSFGPYDDVPSVAMGASPRAFFHDGQLCAGCHQYEQAVLVPGQVADPRRWPTGLLPVHTTWSEWRDGPLGGAAPCGSCHMLAEPTVGNSADLGADEHLRPGPIGGWYRAPGEVRRHDWPGAALGPLAVGLSLSATAGPDGWTVEVQTHNFSAGHAVPTGDPLRQLLLTVEGACGGQPLSPVGGEALDALAGFVDPAGPGERVRVVRPGEGFRDYPAVAPFSGFSVAEKGLADDEVLLEEALGPRQALPPLPEGRVFRGDPVPQGAGPSPALAGVPGRLFARVLVGADGTRGVHHAQAVDVAFDTRLPPASTVTTVHHFAACADPSWRAALWYRPIDRGLGQALGLTPQDELWAEVRS